VDASVAAGVDGVLIVDMPPEESHDLKVILDATAMDSIFLVAPTTSEERAKRICALSSGYYYYVSLKGVTGAGHMDMDSVRENLARLRANTTLPVGVGFGIKDVDTARQISELADAVVVGSALVSKIAELEKGRQYSPEELQAHIGIIRQMRDAMDA
jgi:tryptophan synthase alpha chain